MRIVTLNLFYSKTWIIDYICLYLYILLLYSIYSILGMFEIQWTDLTDVVSIDIVYLLNDFIILPIII